MPKSKQTHIFATKLDFVPGLIKIETESGVRYARCGAYAGSIFEQYVSLAEWDDLGKNTTGSHASGPQFLVVPKSQKINIEAVQASGGRSGFERPGQQHTFFVDAVGQIMSSKLSFDKALDHLDHAERQDPHLKDPGSSYVLSQRLNPDSIVFSPGGVYNQLPALTAGHIGTISESKIALGLYRQFVKAITSGFEKIGSYPIDSGALPSSWKR